MAQQDSPGAPRANSFGNDRRSMALEEERQTHSKECPAVRVSHAGKLRGRPPRLIHFVQFQVDDRVREDEASGFPVEEDELLKIPTGKQHLVYVRAPLLRRGLPEVAVKSNADMPCFRSFAHTRRRPRERLGKRLRPLSYVSVMELVRRNEVADLPKPLKLGRQLGIELSGRMKEQITVGQSDDRHPSGVRQWKPDTGNDHVLEWSVNDADVRPDGFVDVDRFIE